MRELNSRGRLFRLDVRPRAVCRAACVLLGLWPASAAGEMAQPYYFAKPAGNGPFAAVVVLHDCTGLGPDRAARHGAGRAS